MKDVCDDVPMVEITGKLLTTEPTLCSEEEGEGLELQNRQPAREVRKEN